MEKNAGKLNYSVARDTDKYITGVGIRFGPHHYVTVNIIDGKPIIEIGATHHGVKFEADKVDGELYQVIEELRKQYPENKTN